MSHITVQDPQLKLVGKGVEPVQIPEIDALVGKYMKSKDAFSKAGSVLTDAKNALMDAMHEHAKELEQPDGDLVYRFNEVIVSVVAGAEKLKVETTRENKHESYD